MTLPASWQSYLTRLFQSVRIPEADEDADVDVGTMHGIDDDGRLTAVRVVRSPDGVFHASPLARYDRFRLPEPRE